MYQREREKKSLSDFCPLLNFVYLCHLFIYLSGHQRSAESCENQSQNTWKCSGRLTKSLEEKKIIINKNEESFVVYSK